MYLLLRFIFLFIMIANVVAQLPTLPPFYGKPIEQLGHWSLYKVSGGHLLVSKGQLSYSESANGRQKILLPNALRQLYLGLFITDRGEQNYFFYVTPLLVDEFLRGSNRADSSNLVATDDGSQHNATLYEHLQRVYPSFTLFSLEPGATPRDVVRFEDDYSLAMKRPFSADEKQLFLPVISIDWHRDNRYIWIDHIWENGVEGQLTERTNHFFKWITDGIRLNNIVAPQVINELYLVSSFDIMRERPFFFINFDFKNLAPIYQSAIAVTE